jgi:hypothetical protein
MHYMPLHASMITFFHTGMKWKSHEITLYMHVMTMYYTDTLKYVIICM